MREGAAEILRAAEALADRPVVIAITGPVGSGKSTLASAIGAALDACIVPTDAYLPDYAHVDELERDLPEHADLDLLARNIADLASTRRASIPIWSFHTHRREGLREVVLTGRSIVVEGIHALDERLHPHLDLRVLVDAPADVRWNRWEHIETSGQRGWGVDLARRHFERVAEPTFAGRLERIRQAADIIVWNA